MENAPILAQSSPSASEPRRVGLLVTFGSVLAAFFGVQSSRARARDFSSGSPVVFFAVALFLTGAFAATVAVIVRLVVASTGAGG